MLKLVFGDVRGALPLPRRLNNEEPLKDVILGRVDYSIGKDGVW